MQIGSYFPNYFSLEDIIVTQEKVPCIVDANLVGMGKISELWNKLHVLTVINVITYSSCTSNKCIIKTPSSFATFL